MHGVAYCLRDRSLFSRHGVSSTVAGYFFYVVVRREAPGPEGSTVRDLSLHSFSQLGDQQVAPPT